MKTSPKKVEARDDENGIQMASRAGADRIDLQSEISSQKETVFATTHKGVSVVDPTEVVVQKVKTQPYTMDEAIKDLGGSKGKF